MVFTAPLDLADRLRKLEKEARVPANPPPSHQSPHHLAVWPGFLSDAGGVSLIVIPSV
jgi:hypothetical protein